ncbi:MAG: phenylalanine--tRNA ligase subunit beta [Candidatus Wallacebacter cryptica]|nr:phenylalanine--tRNA ligase subunit beta [Bacillota bacterium]
MKVSYRWLQEYTVVPWSPQELADRLTMAGIEVESIERLAPELPNVRVGLIEKVEPHPNADLKVCAINVGDQVLNIVCGAPNARVGIKVPVALEGAVLPNGMEIKVAELRGVMSYGMACSEKELGLGDDHSGLLELPEDVEVGLDLTEALGLDDQILDVSIYANRPDCMSMLGIAREVAALAGQELRYPEIKLNESDLRIEELTSVTVEDPEKCPRYTVRVIKNVTLKPSPLWMQQRLIAAGMRPINNVVDITNFVMLETGQPLHAFDYDRLSENRIVVRTPKCSETVFVTLDGVERELTDEMLMICDADSPVCVGGVMGGENSEVTEETKTILLESANFAAANIRRTSRSLAINSEAAARFEKGIDPTATIFALNRAAQLLAELAGGEVASGIIDVNNADTSNKVIELRPQQVNRLLGTEIDEQSMIDILTRLEFAVDHETSPWKVTVPSFRRDLELECDLIEEIARFWGYENIPITLPKGMSDSGGESEELRVVDQLKTQLAGAGLNEIQTFSFVNAASLAQSQLDQVPELARLIELANPLTEEHAVMRTSLMPSLLECAAYNISRQQQDLSMFEISAVYLADELPLTKLPSEERRLGLLLYGKRDAEHWQLKPDYYDFYDLKGLVELILDNFAADFDWERSALPIFHPGRQCQITVDGELIAYFGEVHPEVQKNYRIPDRIYLAEIHLNKLIKHRKPVPRFELLPRYPAVERDLAVLVDEEIPVGAIVEELQSAGGSLLKAVNIFDVYQGKQVEAGKKSIAFSFVFQGERTLTDDEVNQQLKQMYNAIQEKFAAVMR